MDRNVKILDCTLRDGGRVIDCAFPQFHIDGITHGLTEAGIDIIELGFLRGGNVKYDGDSTFFTEMEQARICVPLPQKGDTMYVLFADYGAEYSGWDFSKLPECDGETITGIRLGVRKDNFDAARGTMKLIQDRGYRLFLQMVETRNYSDLEYLRVLDAVSLIKPYVVGIVDTYGRMYKDDLVRIYTMADHNLSDEIILDFHTHNNMQLSFALAQEIVAISRGKRNIVLDATLDGMGKGAGNLNTELIVEYMNNQYGCNYDFDRILDTIDEHILWIKKEQSWGYSVPSLMSGLFSSHPNNVDYLLKKNRLRTKDIRHILSKIDAGTRKRYDYDKLDRAYLEYSSSKCDDRESLNLLRVALHERVVLVVVFGATSRKFSADIIRFIEENNPVVISVNHLYREFPPDYVFYGNNRRYKSGQFAAVKTKRIVTSNISSEDDADIVVDYNKVVSVGYSGYDNSTIMLLNLLRNTGVKNLAIAGLDGFTNDIDHDFSEEVLAHNAPHEVYDDTTNNELKVLLKHFADSLTAKHSVRFLTPSIFQTIFENRR